MTTYRLEFFEDAKKEWDKLDSSVRSQFRKKLSKRLEHPHVASARLHGLPHCYKIKLRSAGYRLIYQVEDDILIVAIVAIGKRERDKAYKWQRSGYEAPQPPYPPHALNSINVRSRASSALGS